MTIRQTDDVALANKIKAKLKENDYYCPCSLIKDKSTKCMCESFRKMIEDGIEGSCHCGLYIIKND